MKLLFLYAILCLAFLDTAYAAPAPPLEFLLQRAETVVLVKVASVNEDSVTFHCTEILRGEAANEFTLSRGTSSLEIRFHGSEFLLISQGDARFGPPLLQLGRPLRSQEKWRGWTPLPVVHTGDRVFVEEIYSSTDGPPLTDNPPDHPMGLLGLNRIKSLIQRFPYKPHVNDKP